MSPTESLEQSPRRLERHLPLSRLRSFITVLVVAHHSVIAYCVHARFDAAHYLRGAPIVDSTRWPGSDLFVHVNDVFFMPLMFFVSGLFVWPGLAHGAGAYWRRRAERLGAPFAIAVCVLMPLAFYPSFRMTGAGLGYFDFWRQCFSLHGWPAGPAWFLWVLLALDSVAAALCAWAPSALHALGRRASHAHRRPFAFLARLVLWSGTAYLVMLYAFGPTRWFSVGPFSVWASRLPLYVVYFFAGVGVGVHGLPRGLLATDGALVRRWAFWLLAGAASFALLCGLEQLHPGTGDPARVLTLGAAWGLLFAVACGFLGFAGLALFMRFARGPMPRFDRLSESAYGIYVVHYIFVVWLQYELMPAALSPITKGGIVFFVAMALSWALVAAVRQWPTAVQKLERSQQAG